MNQPVDLLLITWNRRAYVEKTLATLLSDAADFRLYCWDNASTDGTADIIASARDPRIARKHFNKENANQRQPCLWFFQEATNDLIGKVDDDVLLPAGWTARLGRIIRSDERFGMLGCWIFMPEDWNEERATHNIVNVAGHRIFRTTMIAGHSFVTRKQYIQRYISPPGHYGLPVDRIRMSEDGLVSGYPLPLLFAHNMDDPRSSNNCFTRVGDNFHQQSALTARTIGFKSGEEYAEWIAADARRRQEVPYEIQMKEELRSRRERTFIGRVRRKVQKLIGIDSH